MVRTVKSLPVIRETQVRPLGREDPLEKEMATHSSLLAWIIPCCCSLAQLCSTLYDPMDCNASGFPVHHHLLELTQTHVHRVGDAIQPSHPLWPTSPPALSLSQHQGLSNEPALHIRWPKYWIFSFSISSSNEYSGFIFFRIDWFDFLTIKVTLKSLFQHHSLKVSIL